jgi:histone acetyltransferase (RNA polymerase elongator complex component)
LKTSIIPIFIPHLGCPHLCTFCNQKKISGTLKIPLKEDIIALVDEYISADISKVYELAFFGGSFTALELDLQKYYLETAAKLKDENKIVKIRYSTRPDCINEQVLDISKKYKTDIIELGLQSMDNKVLRLAERGHTAEDTINAAELIKKYGFSLGLQIMPGLMGDTEKSIMDTFRKAAELKPNFVRIYPTIVIKGTKLEEYYNKKEYEPMALQKMVELTARGWEIFEKNNIKIIRMGLQHSENLTSEKDLTAGPYHPAFGELVLSEIFRNRIISKILQYNLNDKKEILIKINSSELSKARGHKNYNIKSIKENYNIDLKFITDDSFKKGQIEIEV